jgi:hypothetical protein
LSTFNILLGLWTTTAHPRSLPSDHYSYYTLGTYSPELSS